ncbi:MAG TPA: cupin domain-containing protein [Oculatellaceae cyanobacterium]
MALEAVKSKNFARTDIGEFAKLGHDADSDKNAKQFLRDVLGLTGMEISVTHYGPGTKTPFFHSHKQNEELYIVVKGSGQMQLDDELFELKEGTFVRVLPQASRCIKADANSELVFLCIQAKDGSLEQCNRADGVRENTSELWK